VACKKKLKAYLTLPFGAGILPPSAKAKSLIIIIMITTNLSCRKPKLQGLQNTCTVKKMTVEKDVSSSVFEGR